MSIRFAPAQGALPRMSPRRVREGRRDPANDNGRGYATDAMLHAALRHFAEHGLAAAQRARVQAEAALSAHDRQAYLWWFEICRALDRGIARDLAVAARNA